MPVVASAWSPEELTTLARGMREDVAQQRYLAHGKALRDEQKEMIRKLADYFDPLHKQQKLDQWESLLEAGLETGDYEALVTDWESYFSPEQQRGLLDERGLPDRVGWKQMLEDPPTDGPDGPVYQEWKQNLYDAWDARLLHGTANYAKAATGVGKSGAMAHDVFSFRAHVDDPDKNRILILAPTVALAEKAVQDIRDEELFAPGLISENDIGIYHHEISNNKIGRLGNTVSLNVSLDPAEASTSAEEPILTKISGARHALRNLENTGLPITITGSSQNIEVERDVEGALQMVPTTISARSSMVRAFEEASTLEITPTQVYFPDLPGVDITIDPDAQAALQAQLADGESLRIELQRNTERRTALQRPVVAMTQNSFNALREKSIQGTSTLERIDADDFGLIEIDEVHASAGGRVGVRSLEGCREYALIKGQTATPIRAVGNIADKLFEGQFPFVDIGLQRAVNAETLSPVVEAAAHLEVTVDSEVRQRLRDARGDDFPLDALDALAKTTGRAEAIVDTYAGFQCKHTGFRSLNRKAIDFCGSQDAARLHARTFESRFGAGYAARVDADTPKTKSAHLSDEQLREEYIQYQADYQAVSGKIGDDQMLDRRVGLDGLLRLMAMEDESVNLKVLNTPRTLELGIDIPDLDLVIMSTPTQSVARYEQRLGRVTRSTEGKELGYVLRIVDQDLEKQGVGLGHILHDGKFYLIPRGGEDAVDADLYAAVEEEYGLDGASISIPADVEWEHFVEETGARVKASELQRLGAVTDEMELSEMQVPFTIKYELLDLEVLAAEGTEKEIDLWLTRQEVREIAQDRLEENGQVLDRTLFHRLFKQLGLPSEEEPQVALERLYKRHDEIVTLEDCLRRSGLGEAVGFDPEDTAYAHAHWRNTDMRDRLQAPAIHRDVLESVTEYFHTVAENRWYPLEGGDWLDEDDTRKALEAHYNVDTEGKETFSMRIADMLEAYRNSDPRDSAQLFTKEKGSLAAGFLSYRESARSESLLIHRDGLARLAPMFTTEDAPTYSADEMLTAIGAAYGSEVFPDHAPSVQELFQTLQAQYDSLEDTGLGAPQPLEIQGPTRTYRIFSDMVEYDAGDTFRISAHAMPILAELAYGRIPEPRVDRKLSAGDLPNWDAPGEVSLNLFWRWQENDSVQNLRSELSDAWDHADLDNQTLDFRGYALPLAFFEEDEKYGNVSVYTHAGIQPVMQMIVHEKLYQDIADTLKKPEIMESFDARVEALLDQVRGQTPETLRAYPSLSPETIQEYTLLNHISGNNETIPDAVKEGAGGWMSSQDIRGLLYQLHNDPDYPLPDEANRALFRVFMPKMGLSRGYNQRVQSHLRYGSVPTAMLPYAASDIGEMVLSLDGLKIPTGYIDPGEVLRFHTEGVRATLEHTLKELTQETGQKLDVELAPANPDDPFDITLQPRTLSREEILESAREREEQHLERVKDLLEPGWITELQAIDVITELRLAGRYRAVYESGEDMPDDPESVRKEISQNTAARYGPPISNLFGQMRARLERDETIGAAKMDDDTVYMASRGFAGRILPQFNLHIPSQYAPSGPRQR